MPTTRRTFLGLGAAAAATVTLAACSSQGGESSGGSGGISLWTHNGGNEDELAVVQSAVDAFNEANPDTSVDLKSFPQASYNDSIAAAAVCPTSSTSTVRSCRTGPGPVTCLR